MAKKTIKIRFVGKDWDKLPAGEVPFPFSKYLNIRYDLDFSDNPDYVISKESRDFYASCLLRFPDAKIRILFAGEAFVPDFNIFDYAIGFDRLKFGDRFFRLNTFNFFKFDTTSGELEKGSEWCDKVFHSERSFCNFIYSNGRSHPMRKQLYDALSEYKKVDAAGALLRNTEKRVQKGENWMQAKVDFQKNYKFSTAIENSHYVGYTTEKLLHPMAAGSIPIYWGNPEVGKEFNTRAFINCHDYHTLQDIVEEVKKIDRNDQLYRSMLCEPWLTHEQAIDNKINEEKFEKFIFSIFDNDLSHANRRGNGTWSWRYEDTLRKRIYLHNKYLKSPKHRIIRRLQKWGFKFLNDHY